MRRPWRSGSGGDWCGERLETPGQPPVSGSSVTSEAPAAISSVEQRPSELSRLVTEALAGDRAAVEHLLGAVRSLVYRYCRARLARMPGSDHVAEDVAQEVCIAVLTALPRYRDEGKPFEAFVYRIAANKVADAQRAGVRAPVPTDEVPDVIDLADNPEDHAVRADGARRARALLARLPEQQRELLMMRVA
ncbi:MAG: sigma-70 family RNA polymerase sigma factor, partial [Kineosporiaceae bacterium]